MAITNLVTQPETQSQTQTQTPNPQEEREVLARIRELVLARRAAVAQIEEGERLKKDLDSQLSGLLANLPDQKCSVRGAGVISLQTQVRNTTSMSGVREYLVNHASAELAEQAFASSTSSVVIQFVTFRPERRRTPETEGSEGGAQ